MSRSRALGVLLLVITFVLTLSAAPLTLDQTQEFVLGFAVMTCLVLGTMLVL